MVPGRGKFSDTMELACLHERPMATARKKKALPLIPCHVVGAETCMRKRYRLAWLTCISHWENAVFSGMAE